MTKLTQVQKAAAKLAAEERSALEFQDGYDLALAGQPAPRISLLQEAGYIAGAREKRRRDRERADERTE